MLETGVSPSPSSGSSCGRWTLTRAPNMSALLRWSQPCALAIATSKGSFTKGPYIDYTCLV